MLGRILNRFAADMDQIDVNLPETFEIMATFSFFVMFTIAIIAIIIPWFLIPLTVVLIVRTNSSSCFTYFVYFFLCSRFRFFGFELSALENNIACGVNAVSVESDLHQRRCLPFVVVACNVASGVVCSPR